MAALFAVATASAQQPVRADRAAVQTEEAKVQSVQDVKSRKSQSVATETPGKAGKTKAAVAPKEKLSNSPQGPQYETRQLPMQKPMKVINVDDIDSNGRVKREAVKKNNERLKAEGARIK